MLAPFRLEGIIRRRSRLRTRLESEEAGDDSAAQSRDASWTSGRT